MSGETITVNETSQTVTVNQTTNTVEISAPSLTVEVSAPGPQGPSGSATTSVEDLTDTTITSLVEDQLLIYDGLKWVNRALIGPDIPNLDASKITTGTFSDPQVAESNVTQHATAVAAAVDLNDIGNVSATSPIAANSFLVYDGTWNKTTPANARTSLGLGTAATSDTGDFEPAGTVSTHAVVTSGVHGISSFGSTLIDDADAATARTTLGLGTAATSDTGDFESSGSVSTHAAVTSGVHGISTFGASLVDDGDAATARTTLGLGTAATSNTGDFAAAVHTHALGDLSDVDTSGATTGQVLEFDGAGWVPATPSGGGGGANDYISQPTYTNNQAKLWYDFLNAVPDRLDHTIWWLNNGGSGVSPEESTIAGSRGAVSFLLNANNDRYTFWGPSVLTGPQEADGDEIVWEARCYFVDSVATAGTINFGLVDQLSTLNSNDQPPGAGYSPFDQVGLSIDLSQTYLQWFVKDTGAAGSPTVADLTSYPISSYVDTWFRFGIHAKYNATNLNWDITLYVNGTSVATTTMTFDSILTPYVGGGVGTSAGTCVVHIDWISCQYKIGSLVAGRTDHVSLEDI